MASEYHCFPLIRRFFQGNQILMHQRRQLICNRKSGSQEQVRNKSGAFKPFTSESETFQKHRSQRVPWNKVGDCERFGIGFWQRPVEKKQWKKQGDQFCREDLKKNKSADFSVDMNPFKLPCRYEDICTASHVMCRQYWGVMSPKRRDFHSKHALSPQAQTSSNGCLVLVYPPGNGYLSHQTGSSEYHHWLKSASFKQGICDVIVPGSG